METKPKILSHSNEKKLKTASEFKVPIFKFEIN